MFKIDLHVHSQYSEDATGTPEQIIKILQKKGLHGVAFTDHNTVEGAVKATKIQVKDFLVIPGLEISTLQGHLLALNVKEPVLRNLSVEETVERIRNLGGIPVVPHLFRRMSGIKPDNLQKIIQKVPAMEVFNGCSLPKTNMKTVQVARELHLGGTGGSDTHEATYAGYAYTVFETSDLSMDTILSELEKKRTWGEGATMPLSYRRDRMLKSIKQFFQRGFKRI
ncbi:MAG: PHP domain-containing protein [Methanobacteriota archaeon]